MNLSVREQILRAVVANLQGESFPAKNVYRSRLDQLEQADLPCFDVSPGDEKISTDG